jgi:protease PrsW
MTVVLPDLRAARLAAIDASGVAAGFRFFQPRNPAFWVYVWAVATGLVRLVSFYQPQFSNYGGSLIGGAAAYALYTGVWIAFLHSLDRFTPTSPKLLAVGFVWGAVVATTFLALTVNGAVLSMYAKLFGQAWSRDWAAGFTAPFTEETAKAIGFVLLLGWAPRLFKSAFDAFIVGAFIGLGFEVAEDVLYVFQGAAASFGTGQAVSAVQISLLRAVSGAVSHAMFTAFVCTGLMWILGRDPRGRHVGKGITLILVAVVVHSGWDNAGAIGANLLGSLGILVTFVLLAVGIVAVVWLGKDSAATERTWARDILAPETASGVITEAELDALTGTHKDRRRYIKTIDGHHARKVAKHVLAAGRDLCATIGENGGEDTPSVVHARAEIARLRTS